MTARLENYFFVNHDGSPVVPDTDGDVYLTGEVYEREGFEDGSFIRTSYLEGWNEYQARTGSGTVYELGQINADYEEMLKAIDEGVSVIVKWELDLKENILNQIPPDDCYDPEEVAKYLSSANMHAGYMLSGQTLEDDMAHGEIVGQDGNYVTLRVGEGFQLKNKRYFVCWNDPHFTMKISLFCGRVCGISVLEESFMVKGCRPKFF